MMKWVQRVIATREEPAPKAERVWHRLDELQRDPFKLPPGSYWVQVSCTTCGGHGHGYYLNVPYAGDMEPSGPTKCFSCDGKGTVCCAPTHYSKIK